MTFYDLEAMIRALRSCGSEEVHSLCQGNGSTYQAHENSGNDWTGK